MARGSHRQDCSRLTGTNLWSGLAARLGTLLLAIAGGVVLLALSSATARADGLPTELGNDLGGVAQRVAEVVGSTGETAEAAATQKDQPTTTSARSDDSPAATEPATSESTSDHDSGDASDSQASGNAGPDHSSGTGTQEQSSDATPRDDPQTDPVETRNAEPKVDTPQEGDSGADKTSSAVGNVVGTDSGTLPQGDTSEAGSGDQTDEPTDAPSDDSLNDSAANTNTEASNADADSQPASEGDNASVPSMNPAAGPSVGSVLDPVTSSPTGSGSTDSPVDQAGTPDSTPPVTDTAAEPLDPVAEPAAGDLQPVVQLPVPTVDPVVGVVVPPVHPVIDVVVPTVDPLVPVADDVVTPVVPVIDPIVTPLIPIVDTMPDPIVDMIDPIVDPIIAPIADPIIDPSDPVMPPLDGDPGIETAPPGTLVPPTAAITPAPAAGIEAGPEPIQAITEPSTDGSAAIFLSPVPRSDVPGSTTPAGAAARSDGHHPAAGDDAADPTSAVGHRADAGPVPSPGHGLKSETGSSCPAPNTAGGTGGGASGSQPHVGASAVVPDSTDAPIHLRQALTPNERTGHSALLALAKYRPD